MDPAPAPAPAVDPCDLTTLPGYAEAIQADREAHDLAFLGDVPRPVAGSPCLPLDLRTLLICIHAENPFLCGGSVDLEHVRQILWLLHPLYRPGDDAALAAFRESLAGLDLDFARGEVRAFLEETFADAPGGKPPRIGRDGKPLPADNATSFVATWVDLLASEYSWSEAEIIGTATRRGIALTRLYQYRVTIARRSGQPLPNESGRVLRLIGNWLRSL